MSIWEIRTIDGYSQEYSQIVLYINRIFENIFGNFDP